MINIKGIINSPLARKVAKSTSIYATGNLINKAIPFLLLPVLTRFLSPQDYGILATFMAIFGIIYTVIYMGTIDAITRGYFDREKTGFNFSEYVFNGFFINVMVFFVILILWCLFKHYLERIIPIPFGYQLLILFLGFFVAAYSIPSKLWVMMKKPLPYTLFKFSNTLIELSLSILLVVAIGLNWRGRVWGLAASRLLFFIIGVYVLYKNDFFRIRINKIYLKDILNYGFPIVLHSLGFVIIVAIDKFFLNAFVDLSTTGIYSVSYYICSIIAFSTGAFNLAWTPVIYEKLGNPTNIFKVKLVKFTYIYFILILLGVLLFIKLVPYVLGSIVGKDFLGARIFIFWLALGFGFHSIYTMVVTYIFYTKRTYVLSKIAVITVILSIVLNYILVKANGAVGVAQATCLVFFSRFLLVWYFSNKVYPMPWFSFAKSNQ